MGGAAPAGGFEFGVNPDDDPELALALRVSMEEQRARQQAEGGAPEGGETPAVAAGAGGEDETSEEAMLQRELAMSMDSGEAPTTRAAPQARDLGSMTEEEQIAHPMQMSMAEAEKADEPSDEKDQDYSLIDEVIKNEGSDSKILSLSSMSVNETSTKEEVTQAYKQLRKLVHPDKNHGKEEKSTKAFQLLKRAFDRLSESKEQEQKMWWLCQWVLVPVMIAITLCCGMLGVSFLIQN